MVSRQHAELRLLSARVHLVDLDSKHGTFLNGQRLSKPTAVRGGLATALGQEGPLFIVELIEDESSYSTFKHTLVDDQNLKATTPPKNAGASCGSTSNTSIFGNPGRCAGFGSFPGKVWSASCTWHSGSGGQPGSAAGTVI